MQHAHVYSSTGIWSWCVCTYTCAYAYSCSASVAALVLVLVLIMINIRIRARVDHCNIDIYMHRMYTWFEFVWPWIRKLKRASHMHGRRQVRIRILQLLALASWYRSWSPRRHYFIIINNYNNRYHFVYTGTCICIYALQMWTYASACACII